MLSDEEISAIFSVRRGAVTESHLLGCARAIESAATAPLLADIERLTRELEEARKDAELLDGLDGLLQGGTLTIRTVHFLSAASRVQISHDGEDAIGDSFNLRDAIRAAIKEQT